MKNSVKCFFQVIKFSLFLLFPYFSFASENPINSQKMDKFLLGSQWVYGFDILISPYYQGFYKEIWDTVDYLAILQRKGSKKEQIGSMALGVSSGIGRIVYQDSDFWASVGAGYEMSFFSLESRYIFGENEKNEENGENEFDYAPSEGSQQNLAIKGLEHNIFPYIEVGMKPSRYFPFPIKLQWSLGVVLAHILDMNLIDHDHKVHHVNIFQPNKSIELKSEELEGRALIDFGLKNTSQMAFTTGFKVFLGNLVTGMNYSTNMIESSLKIQIGLSLH